MSRMLAISSGPIKPLDPSDKRASYTTGETVVVNGCWAVILPNLPEVFHAGEGTRRMLEEEMSLRFFGRDIKLQQLDTLFIQIRDVSEAKILSHVSDILIPEKVILVVSREVGRQVLADITRVGYQWRIYRSRCSVDTEPLMTSALHWNMTMPKVTRLTPEEESKLTISISRR